MIRCFCKEFVTTVDGGENIADADNFMYLLFVENDPRKAIEGINCWIDSMTVLCWIKNQKPWGQYVSNMVR